MLNKQGPDKIDWTGYTWNPIAGCNHGCPYCYMLRMEKRFPGTMDYKYRVEYLADPFKLKNPSKIFVGSSGDMWGEWVPDEQIESVLRCVGENPKHTFQFLTKNPKRYVDFKLPLNGWYGTTIDGTSRTWPQNLKSIKFVKRIVFISFEPLLNPIDPDLEGIDWIIIGANSNRGAERPPGAWAKRLILNAWFFNIPVWIKDNYGFPKRIKEMPTQ